MDNQIYFIVFSCIGWLLVLLLFKSKIEKYKIVFIAIFFVVLLTSTFFFEKQSQYIINILGGIVIGQFFYNKFVYNPINNTQKENSKNQQYSANEEVDKK